MKRAAPFVAFAAMCLVWGTTWLAAKAGVNAVPPCFFVATRFIVAGPVLLGWARLRGQLSPVPARDLPRLVAVTLLMVTATYALLFWGVVFVSSGLAAILDLSFMPIALLGIGLLLGEERFSLLRAVGIALGVVGILVLFGPKAMAGGRAGGAQLAGGAAIIASSLVYSLGSVLARPLLRRYPPVLLSGVTTLGGGLVLLAGSLLLEPGATRAASLHWGRAAWAGWLFLVLFGSLVAYTIYLHLIRVWGPSRAGSYAFVSPVFAVLLGALVFGEQVGAGEVTGMVVMLAGAFLALRPAQGGPGSGGGPRPEAQSFVAANS